MGLQTPIVLAVFLVLLHLGVLGAGIIAVVPFAVTLGLAVVCTVFAARRVRPVLWSALQQVPRLRTFRGAKVFDVAWPSLIQLIALPLAMQTDRLVLSHAGDGGALAEYNLSSQMFTPIWLVVNTGGFTLWAVFARARERGETASPLPMAAAFAGISGVMALGVAVASRFLAELASGGAITISWPVVVSFAVLMVFQGAKYPLGMYLTDAAGLRFQALMVVLMLPVNLGLSIWLADWIGPAGPVIGSIIGVAVFQFACSVVNVRRRLARAVEPGMS
jgi:O-antigen/teichoic acid export membrane protein